MVGIPSPALATGGFQFSAASSVSIVAVDRLGRGLVGKIVQYTPILSYHGDTTANPAGALGE